MERTTGIYNCKLFLPRQLLASADSARGLPPSALPLRIALRQQRQLLRAKLRGQLPSSLTPKAVKLHDRRGHSGTPNPPTMPCRSPNICSDSGDSAKAVARGCADALEYIVDVKACAFGGLAHLPTAPIALTFVALVRGLLTPQLLLMLDALLLGALFGAFLGAFLAPAPQNINIPALCS